MFTPHSIIRWFWNPILARVLSRDTSSGEFSRASKGVARIELDEILPLDSGTQNWGESCHGTRPPPRVTAMAGVQAVAARGDDEHGHYDADDYSSLITDSATTDSTLHRDSRFPESRDSGQIGIQIRESPYFRNLARRDLT